jgi:hypothetical protein
MLAALKIWSLTEQLPIAQWIPSGGFTPMRNNSLWRGSSERPAVCWALAAKREGWAEVRVFSCQCHHTDRC